ncbi:hypothetical protein [Photobacterium leiognathi]|uniref:hypothetical protein n=1 Tax=Photobacterium leiognathi TaxID=553611 RepID=UPI003AF38191
MDWVSIVDTAVKIGFGAGIAAISGYVSLIKNQTHETNKLKREHFYSLQSEKKQKYAEYLAQSDNLLKIFRYKNAETNSSELSDYSRIYHEIMIICDDSFRTIVATLYVSIIRYVNCSKEPQEKKINEEYYDSVSKNIALFQKIAQEEVTKEYLSTHK